MRDVDLVRERHHDGTVATGSKGRCQWCGTDWPCDAAFLLEVIDQMKAEHLTALATAFLAGGRGKDE